MKTVCLTRKKKLSSQLTCYIYRRVLCFQFTGLRSSRGSRRGFARRPCDIYLEIDRRLGRLVRVLLPGQQASDVAPEVLHVGVVEELLYADLGVGFGLLHFGIDRLLYGYFNFLW